MPDLYPCDATAEVSPCCSGLDFCLSNGLCLDAGSNNGFTQQGCTSKGWDFPCRQYCPNSAGKAGTFRLMLPLARLTFLLYGALIYVVQRGLSLLRTMLWLRRI